MADVGRALPPSPPASADRRSSPRRAEAGWARGVTTWLARRRVALGFVFGALVLWLAQPTAVRLTLGTAVACAGEALRIWAAGHLNKSREVTTSGPYRWMAHPLYIGSSVMGAGLAIACGSLAVVVAIAIYLSATLTVAIRNEEAFLRRAFGDRYDRYRRAAPADAQAEAPRRFALAQVWANREHRAAIGLALAVLLLFFKATYNGLFWR